MPDKTPEKSGTGGGSGSDEIDQNVNPFARGGLPRSPTLGRVVAPTTTAAMVVPTTSRSLLVTSTEPPNLPLVEPSVGASASVTTVATSVAAGSVVCTQQSSAGTGDVSVVHTQQPSAGTRDGSVVYTQAGLGGEPVVPTLHLETGAANTPAVPTHSLLDIGKESLAKSLVSLSQATEGLANSEVDSDEDGGMQWGDAHDDSRTVGGGADGEEWNLQDAMVDIAVELEDLSVLTGVDGRELEEILRGLDRNTQRGVEVGNGVLKRCLEAAQVTETGPGIFVGEPYNRRIDELDVVQATGQSAREIAEKATKNQEKIEGLLGLDWDERQRQKMTQMIWFYQAVRVFVVPIAWSSECWAGGLEAYQRVGAIIPLVIQRIREFLSAKRLEETAHMNYSNRGYTWKRVVSETGNQTDPVVLAELCKANLTDCLVLTRSLEELKKTVKETRDIAVQLWKDYEVRTSPAFMFNCPDVLAKWMPKRTTATFTLLMHHYLWSVQVPHLTLRPKDILFYENNEENREMLSWWVAIGKLRLFRQTCARAWRAITKNAAIQVKPGPNGVLGFSHQGVMSVLDSITAEIDGILNDEVANHWRVAGCKLLKDIEEVINDYHGRRAAVVDGYHKVVFCTGDEDQRAQINIQHADNLREVTITAVAKLERMCYGFPGAHPVDEEVYQKGEQRWKRCKDCRYQPATGSRGIELMKCQVNKGCRARSFSQFWTKKETPVVKPGSKQGLLWDYDLQAKEDFGLGDIDSSLAGGPATSTPRSVISAICKKVSFKDVREDLSAQLERLAVTTGEEAEHSGKKSALEYKKKLKSTERPAVKQPKGPSGKTTEVDLRGLHLSGGRLMDEEMKREREAQKKLGAVSKRVPPLKADERKPWQESGGMMAGSDPRKTDFIAPGGATRISTLADRPPKLLPRTAESRFTEEEILAMDGHIPQQRKKELINPTIPRRGKMMDELNDRLSVSENNSLVAGAYSSDAWWENQRGGSLAPRQSRARQREQKGRRSRSNSSRSSRTGESSQSRSRERRYGRGSSSGGQPGDEGGDPDDPDDDDGFWPRRPPDRPGGTGGGRDPPRDPPRDPSRSPSSSPPTSSDDSDDGQGEARHRRLLFMEAADRSAAGLAQIGLSDEEIKTMRKIDAYGAELAALQRQVDRTMRKKGLYEIEGLIEDADDVLMMSERTTAQLTRLSKSVESTLEMAQKLRMSEDCAGDNTKIMIKRRITPYCHSLGRSMDRITSMLKVKADYKKKEQDRASTATSQCIKALDTGNVKPWVKSNEAYVFFMYRFSKSQRLVTDNILRYKRLEQAMSLVQKAKDILSIYHEDNYDTALKALHSVFGSMHSSWVAIASKFGELPVPCASEQEMEKLHWGLKKISAYLEMWPSLKTYCTEQWVLKAVLLRLTQDGRMVYTDKKCAWERVNMGENETTTHVHFMMEVWSPKEYKRIQEMNNLLEGARYDPNTGVIQSIKAAAYGTGKDRPSSDKKRNQSKVNNHATKTPNLSHAQKKKPPKKKVGAAGPVTKSGDSAKKKQGKKSSTNKTETKKDSKPAKGGSKAGAKGPQKKTTRVFSCKVCDKADCTPNYAMQCRTVKAALSSEDRQAKMDVFKKVVEKANVCPLCRGNLSAGVKHVCPKTCKVKGKDGAEKILDVASWRCPDRCEFKLGMNVFQMPRYLCKCGRKQPEFNFKKTNTNVGRIVNVGKSTGWDKNTGADQGTGRDNSTMHVHWEELCHLADQDGVKVPVLLSLDSCSDFSLCNTATFDRLAVNESPVTYTLQTASSAKEVDSRQGTIPIKTKEGKVVELEVLECPVEGEENVLNRNQLSAAEVSKEAAKYVDLADRDEITGYHVLVGQNGHALLPESTTYITPDGKGAVRSSKVTGKGILQGEWPKKLSTMVTTFTWASWITSFFTGVSELDSKTDQTEETTGTAVLARLAEPGDKLDIQALPIPLGDPASNQGLTGEKSSRQFPRPDDPLILPDGHQLWSPRLPGMDLPGDRACCFGPNHDGDGLVDPLATVLVHNGRCPAEPTDLLPASALCTRCQELRDGLSDETSGEGPSEEELADMVPPDSLKEVTFGSINMIGIPRPMTRAELSTGVRSYEKPGKLFQRMRDFKKLREQVMLSAMGKRKSRKIMEMRLKRKSAVDNCEKGKNKKCPGHLGRAIRRQIMAEQKSRGKSIPCLLVPDVEDEEMQGSQKDEVQQRVHHDPDGEIDLQSEVQSEQVHDDDQAWEGVKQALRNECADIDFLDQSYVRAGSRHRQAGTGGTQAGDWNRARHEKWLRDPENHNLEAFSVGGKTGLPDFPERFSQVRFPKEGDFIKLWFGEVQKKGLVKSLVKRVGPWRATYRIELQPSGETVEFLISPGADDWTLITDQELHQKLQNCLKDHSIEDRKTCRCWEKGHTNVVSSRALLRPIPVEDKTWDFLRREISLDEDVTPVVGNYGTSVVTIGEEINIGPDSQEPGQAKGEESRDPGRDECRSDEDESRTGGRPPPPLNIWNTCTRRKVVTRCHFCALDRALGDRSDLWCMASRLHKKGDLFSEIDRQFVARLDARSRLEWLNVDPCSIAEVTGLAQCPSCKTCGCVKSPTDFFRAGIQRKMVDKNVALVPVEDGKYRFEAKLVENETAKDLDPRSARRESLQRAKQIHRGSAKRGSLPHVQKEFRKQLEKKYFQTVEEYRADHPEFDDYSPGWFALNYAIKSAGQVDGETTTLDSKTKVRLVSDASVATRLKSGGVSHYNNSVESGYSDLPLLGDSHVRFRLGEDAVTSDLAKAYFSVLNACRVVARSRFFFSLSEEIEPPDEDFTEWCQLVLSMGGESSSNVLSSALIRTAMDPQVMEIDLKRFPQDESDIYIDDVLCVGGDAGIDDRELGSMARLLSLHIAQKRAWESRGFSLPEGYCSALGVVRASNDEVGRPDVVTEALDILEQSLSNVNILDAKGLKEIEDGERKLPENQPYEALNHFLTRDSTYCTSSFLGRPWKCDLDVVGLKQNLRPRAVRRRGQRVGEEIKKIEDVRPILTKAPLTRRQKASIDMALFDPTGGLVNAGLNTRLKPITTDTMASYAAQDKVMGWDDVVPEEFIERLIPVVEDSIRLCEVWEPRYQLVNRANAHKYQPILCAVADASDRMTGCGTWLTQVPKDDYEKFSEQMRKDGGITDVILELKEPVTPAEKVTVYGDLCEACDREQAEYERSGQLPKDWARPHQGHCHTLMGKKSTRMGRWLQQLAANVVKRATHSLGCEGILGPNYKKLLPRLKPEVVNYTQLLATRQKICQARTTASVQFLEFAAQDLSARVARHYQSLCEKFFGVPHPVWVMSDSRVSLSLMNSQLWNFGLKNNALHRLLSIQSITNRADSLLFHVEGAKNPADYFTKHNHNSLEYTVTALQVGEFLHLNVKDWPVSAATNTANYEAMLSELNDMPSLFANNASRKKSRLKIESSEDLEMLANKGEREKVKVPDGASGAVAASTRSETVTGSKLGELVVEKPEEYGKNPRDDEDAENRDDRQLGVEAYSHDVVMAEGVADDGVQLLRTGGGYGVVVEEVPELYTSTSSSDQEDSSDDLNELNDTSGTDSGCDRTEDYFSERDGQVLNRVESYAMWERDRKSCNKGSIVLGFNQYFDGAGKLTSKANATMAKKWSQVGQMQDGPDGSSDTDCEEEVAARLSKRRGQSHRRAVRVYNTLVENYNLEHQVRLKKYEVVSLKTQRYSASSHNMWRSVGDGVGGGVNSTCAARQTEDLSSVETRAKNNSDMGLREGVNWGSLRHTDLEEVNARGEEVRGGGEDPASPSCIHKFVERLDRPSQTKNTQENKSRMSHLLPNRNPELAGIRLNWSTEVGREKKPTVGMSHGEASSESDVAWLSPTDGSDKGYAYQARTGSDVTRHRARALRVNNQSLKSLLGYTNKNKGSESIQISRQKELTSVSEGKYKPSFDCHGCLEVANINLEEVRETRKHLLDNGLMSQAKTAADHEIEQGVELAGILNDENLNHVHNYQIVICNGLEKRFDLGSYRLPGNCFRKLSTNVQFLDLWPPKDGVGGLVADVRWENPATQVVVHSQYCRSDREVLSQREREATCYTERQLVSVELLGPSLARAKSLNGFLSTLARAICVWAGTSLKNMSYLTRYRNVQRMKLRLFTRILNSLAPVVEFLLERHQAIKRRSYVINSLWFCLARPRLGSRMSGEVLLIPSRSMLYKALIKDVHNRFHNSRISVQKMTLDSAVLGLPDDGERQLINAVHNCNRCKFSERSDVDRVRPPAPMPEKPVVEKGITVFSDVTFDSFGPVKVRLSTRSQQMQKAWVTAFLCMYSRAVSLIVHYGMSSEDFSHVLLQHVARYGPPNRLWLDNLAAQLEPLETVGTVGGRPRETTEVADEDLDELGRMAGKQAEKVKQKIARAHFLPADVERGANMFSVELNLSAPGSSQEKCLGENIFRSIGHFLGLSVHYPTKVPTVTEMDTLTAFVQHVVNTRPFAIFRGAKELCAISPAAIAIPTVAAKQHGEHFSAEMSERLASGNYRGARNLVKAVAARLMLALTHYLWVHSTPELPRAHSDDQVLAPGSISYLRDRGAHFWTKLKLCEVVCLVRSPAGWDSHCVVRCAVPAGGRDMNGHPRFRNVFLVRHVTSISKPIVTAQKRREKNYDIDSSVWGDFIKYVGERPIDDNIVEQVAQQKAVEVEDVDGLRMTEPYPVGGRPEEEDLIPASAVAFDPITGLFKLKLKSREVSEIFSEKNREAVRKRFEVETEEDREIPQETPETERMTRGKARSRLEEEKNFASSAANGGQPEGPCDYTNLGANRGQKGGPCGHTNLGADRGQKEGPCGHTDLGAGEEDDDLGPAGLLPEHHRWRRGKKANKDPRNVGRFVRLACPVHEPEVGIKMYPGDVRSKAWAERPDDPEEDLDYCREHHTELFLPGADTPLQPDTLIKSGNLILDQGAWPPKDGVFYFSKNADGKFEKVKSIRIVSKNRQKFYEFKIGRLYYRISLLLGDDNWSLTKPREDVGYKKPRKATNRFLPGQKVRLAAVLTALLLMLGVVGGTGEQVAELQGGLQGRHAGLKEGEAKCQYGEVVDWASLTWERRQLIATSSTVRLFRSEKEIKYELCLDIQILPDKAVGKLLTLFPDKAPSWLRSGCGPVWLFHYLAIECGDEEVVKIDMNGYAGLDKVGINLSETEANIRHKRMLDINMNLNLQGSQLSLFRWNHDKYSEYGRTMVEGDHLENAGGIHGVGLPSQSDLIKKNSETCTYYLRLVCMIKERVPSQDKETRKGNVKNSNSPYYGLQVEPSARVSGLIKNVIKVDTDEPGIQVTEVVNDNAEIDVEAFDPLDLSEEVEIQTCIQKSRLVNSYAPLVAYFRDYLIQLRSFLNISIPFHGFLEVPGQYNGESCRNNAPSCLHFVNRQGGAREWVLYEETDDDGDIVVDDFNPPDAGNDLHSLFYQCRWSGGEILDPGDTRWVMARKLCSKPVWNCMYLMSRLMAAHKKLYYENGQPLVGAEEVPSLLALYWNVTDPEVQRTFNAAPFVMTVMHDVEDKKEKDLMITYQGSKQYFPTYSGSRALCVYDETHPAARLAGVLMKYAQDLKGFLPTEVKEFKDREKQLDDIVNGFNDDQKMAFGVEDESCEELHLPISNEVQGRAEINKKLGLTPSGLHRLLERLKGLLDKNLRNPWQECPSCELEKVNKLAPDVRAFEGFLKKYFQVGEAMFIQLEEIVDDLPRKAAGLTLVDEDFLFGGTIEKVVVGVGGGFGIASILINVVLWVVIVICKKQLRKVKDEARNMVEDEVDLPQRTDRMSRPVTPIRSPSQLELLGDGDRRSSEIRFVEVGPSKMSVNEDSRKWLASEDQWRGSRGQFEGFETPALPNQFRRSQGHSKWLNKTPAVYYQK